MIAAYIDDTGRSIDPFNWTTVRCPIDGKDYLLFIAYVEEEPSGAWVAEEERWRVFMNRADLCAPKSTFEDAESYLNKLVGDISSGRWGRYYDAE